MFLHQLLLRCFGSFICDWNKLGKNCHFLHFPPWLMISLTKCLAVTLTSTCFFFLPPLTCSPVSFALPPLLTSYLSHATRALVLQLAPLQEHMRPPQACWTGPTVSNPQSRALRQSKAHTQWNMGTVDLLFSTIIFLQTSHLGFQCKEIFCVFRCIRMNIDILFLSVSVIPGKIWHYVDAHLADEFILFFATPD